MSKRIKIISIGESLSGKTSLIKRYCERRFDKRTSPTIGVDFGSTLVDVSVESETISVYVDIWDFSGKKDFLDVRNELYQEVSAAILVFDVSNQRSFDALEEWLKEIKRYGLIRNKVPITLVGNKIDSIPRKVFKKSGNEFIKKNRLHSYFEVSALDGTNVDAMFTNLFESSFS